MRWLFIIIVSITSCLAGGDHVTLSHEKPSNVTSSTKNHNSVDYQLVPLSKSIFCNPPRAQEGTELMKLKKAAVKSNPKEDLKDPVIVTGVVLFVLIGSILLFPAYYLFRVATALSGFIASIYLTCQLHGYFHPNIIDFPVSIIWICIPVGLGATVVFGYFHSVAKYMLTFLSGWFMVIFWSTVALQTDDIFRHFLFRDFVSFGLGLLFVIGMRFAENITVAISLPFLGSYFIGLGVDLIFQTGIAYTLGTSICFYEPLPKFTSLSALTIFIVSFFWLIGVVAYSLALRGKSWGLNVKRKCKEEEKKGAP